MKTLIIGGVAGGASTAARLRRNDENAEIILIERGNYVSYANCGLPYYLGGVISDREELFVQTPEKLEATFDIDVRVQTEARRIDKDEKRVLLHDGMTGTEYSENYDRLVLSPGAEPIKPPIPGIDNRQIFTLRGVSETDAIKSYLDEAKPTRAVVVGGGFIGLEMAENLHERGIRVTLVEMAEQVMNVLDYEMAAEVHRHLKTKHVEFYLQDGVARFESNGDALAVVLQSGRRIPAEMVILSIGVRPESRLAREAGLAIGETGGIVVDEYLRTSDSSIYAVGDAIEFPHAITGKQTITYLAGPANRQGRITADNIAHGNVRKYRGAIGTAVAKVFDLTVAITGASEKTLRDHETRFSSVITHSSSHAGYYPDAKPMSVKTLFDPEDGRLLGAQIVGYEGVDKRIDLFASVLRHSGTVEELIDLEHAYAPPYSSAKDPVNIAGFVCENIMAGKSRHMQWHELESQERNRIFLLDVRTPEEFERGTIDGAVNIPNTELRDRLDEVPRDKTIVVFCGVGFRAYLSERILRQNGFEDVYNLSGGYTTHDAATSKQSNEDIFAHDVIYKDDHIYQADPGGGRGR